MAYSQTTSLESLPSDVSLRSCGVSVDSRPITPAQLYGHKGDMLSPHCHLWLASAPHCSWKARSTAANRAHTLTVSLAL